MAWAQEGHSGSQRFWGHPSEEVWEPGDDHLAAVLVNLQDSARGFFGRHAVVEA